MSETDLRLRPGSPRAEQLIDAWNRRDVAFVLEQFNDHVKLEAHSPKLPTPELNLSIENKDQLSLALEAYRALHSQFTIISASEDDCLILLTLEDAEGKVLILTLELGEQGNINRMMSYRSSKKPE